MKGSASKALSTTLFNFVQEGILQKTKRMTHEITYYRKQQLVVFPMTLCQWIVQDHRMRKCLRNWKQVPTSLNGDKKNTVSWEQNQPNEKNKD